MAKGPKKSKAQASDSEKMNKRIGGEMVSRGNQLVDSSMEEIKRKLGTDQTQYYSDVSAADDAQARNTTPNIGTLEGDFKGFANNVRGIFDAKRNAQRAAGAENNRLAKSYIDAGNKNNSAALQGLSGLSRLEASGKVADMRNTQSKYAATAGALGTFAGGFVAAEGKPWWRE